PSWKTGFPLVPAGRANLFLPGPSVFCHSPAIPESIMTTILEKIVTGKRQEIAAARSCLSDRELEQQLDRAPPVRNFRAALARPDGIQVIAEVKKASPSAGLLRADFDPVAIAHIYAQHGAAALSVLTDTPFFQGQLSYLAVIRAAVTPPLL